MIAGGQLCSAAIDVQGGFTLQQHDPLVLSLDVAFMSDAGGTDDPLDHQPLVAQEFIKTLTLLGWSPVVKQIVHMGRHSPGAEAQRAGVTQVL